MPSFQRRRNAVKYCERDNTDDTKQRLKVTFSYIGTNYDGYQSQPSGNTVQDIIEMKLKSLYRRRVVIFICGRTDSGVHANRAVFHMDLFKYELEKFDAKFLRYHLSRPFPVKLSSPTIVICSIEQVSNDFDARYSCKKKLYKYQFSLDQASPFSAPYVWSLPETYRAKAEELELNFHALKEGVKLLCGKHNFQWLVITQKNEQRNYTRTLEITLVRENKRLTFYFSCDFFLYRMVRRLVGVLINILIGKMNVNLLLGLIKHFDNFDPDVKLTERQIPIEIEKIRTQHSNVKHLSDILNTAPAKGLFLEQVFY